ncbi:tetratricopeptide repeat protein [Streptomyces sp. MZ04]|uniref:tetratricopeptide repeat protein n=1 Tax=Streptomyces sp. MZ04 TaxID=2559236 RepID=UPI0014328CB2|nr:tetratricopeptide repeat protein [Streptomyces sp. MZ04]
MTANALTDQAGTLLAVGRYDDAKALLAQHLADHPDDLDAWDILACSHANLKEFPEAERAFNEVLRLDPEHCGAYTQLSKVLWPQDRLPEATAAAREAVRLQPGRWWTHSALSLVLSVHPPHPPAPYYEAFEAAQEAVRLGPDQPGAYKVLCLAAHRIGRHDVVEQALPQWLRLDPQDDMALAWASHSQGSAPGVKPAKAADIYAAALAATPNSEQDLRLWLDRAVYHMLRGTRWLALICLAIAGLTVDVLPTARDTRLELPVPPAARLWACVLMTAVWGFGTWWRYRKLSTGVQRNLWSLARRGVWARIVLGQAFIATLCALLIALVPWTDRTVPQILLGAGLLTTFCTLWFDKKKAA